MASYHVQKIITVETKLHRLKVLTSTEVFENARTRKEAADSYLSLKQSYSGAAFNHASQEQYKRSIWAGLGWAGGEPGVEGRVPWGVGKGLPNLISFSSYELCSQRQQPDPETFKKQPDLDTFKPK